METKRVVLVGAGNMAIAYYKVLENLGYDTIVVGRGKQSADNFEKETGHTPIIGKSLSEIDLPSLAIVAANAQYLTAICLELMEAGVKKILLEKPAALDLAELESLVEAEHKFGGNIFVGYNRRFLASTLKVNEMIKEDGGVLSVKFDFSEPSRKIAQLDKPQRELDTWFYGNSSHVVDLAFHFFGLPKTLSGQVAGGVSWHPQGGVFTGSGQNANDGLISWHANWMGPGRWGIEVMTLERRIILQPLEKIRVQTHENFSEVDITFDDEMDKNFKPGLWLQTKTFLENPEGSPLKTISEHHSYFKYYEIVRLGGNSDGR